MSLEYQPEDDHAVNCESSFDRVDRSIEWHASLLNERHSFMSTDRQYHVCPTAQQKIDIHHKEESGQRLLAVDASKTVVADQHRG